MRILCALALVFVGFGHQPSAFAADQLSPADLSQYALPDGSLPTLCVTVTDDSGQTHGKIVHLIGCEACSISAAVLLPRPLDVVGVRIGFRATTELPPRTEAFYRQLFPPNSGPRAPPLNPIHV